MVPGAAGDALVGRALPIMSGPCPTDQVRPLPNYWSIDVNRQNPSESNPTIFMIIGISRYEFRLRVQTVRIGPLKKSKLVVALLNA